MTCCWHPLLRLSVEIAAQLNCVDCSKTQPTIAGGLQDFIISPPVGGNAQSLVSPTEALSGAFLRNRPVAVIPIAAESRCRDFRCTMSNGLGIQALLKRLELCT